jgi:DNA anti-recombination protein RmuC
MRPASVRLSPASRVARRTWRRERAEAKANQIEDELAELKKRMGR